MAYPSPSKVKVKDAMWTPLLERTWRTTIPDVLDKFEGSQTNQNSEDKGNDWSPDKSRTQRDATEEGRNALLNFDRVAQGHKGDGGHTGFPWFDGLIYETITGIADFLLQHPDQQMEARLDGYI